MDKFKIAVTDNYRQVYFLENIISNFDGCFIAGGCFKNIFNQQKIKDLDIFFYSKKHFEQAVAEANDNDRYTFLYRNDNVCCFKYETDNISIKVEMNQKIFGSPMEILKQFDFTITKFALYKEKVNDSDGDDWHWEDRVMYHEDFFEHLFFKRIVVDDKILYPESTYERMIKYMRYGYFPCKETKVKIAKALVALQRELKFSNAFYSVEGLD